MTESLLDISTGLGNDREKIRNPKSEIREKAEDRNPNRYRRSQQQHGIGGSILPIRVGISGSHCLATKVDLRGARFSAFGFRISFELRLSEFGVWTPQFQ